MSEIFDNLCPTYMAYGMSYDEYWNGDAYRPYFYRKAYKEKQKIDDEKLWLQGAYVYDAVARLAPILQAFAKKGTKPTPYPKKPYSQQGLIGEIVEKTEEEKEKEIENGRLAFQVQMNAWAKATQRHFENKQGKEKEGGNNDTQINNK